MVRLYHMVKHTCDWNTRWRRRENESEKNLKKHWPKFCSYKVLNEQREEEA